MKIYTGYPGGITKITNDKGFYQTEDLANVISVYVNQADVTGITYTLALEFLRADGRKTTIYKEDSFASGEATTLTEDNVTYDIHNFTLTNTQLAVAGALAFTCYINILNSGVVEKRGVLFNAVSNVRKTVTYSANTIFVVSKDDEDVPTIVADMKTAIETLAGQLASKVNKADVTDNLTTNDSNKVLSAKQGYILKVMLDALEAAKQDVLTFDSTPTANSTNPVTSGGVKTALDAKADNTTVSGIDNRVGALETDVDTLQNNTYSKTEVDEKIDDISAYTKSEIDTMINAKADKTTVEGINTRVGALETDIADLKSVQNVVEVVATKSALNSYDTSKLDANDKVQVIADETHDGASTIYNWNGSAWVYVGAFGGNSYTKAETYNKTQIDSALSDKADKSNTYTRTVIDSMILTLSTDKADKSDTYTKTEEDAKFEEVGQMFEIVGNEVLKKADKADTYTKQESDNKFATKETAVTHSGNQLQDYSGNNIYPNLDDGSVTKQKFNDDVFLNDEISYGGITFESPKNYVTMSIVFKATGTLNIVVSGELKNNQLTNLIIGTSNTNSTTAPNLVYNQTITGVFEKTTTITSTQNYVHIQFKVSVDAFSYFDKVLEIKTPLIYINDNLMSEYDNIVWVTYTPTSYKYLVTNKSACVNEGYVKDYVKEYVSDKLVIHNVINVSTAQELVSAINSIATTAANNKANKYNVYDIYLASGTYELYDVIDKSDLRDQALFHRGLEIPDYVNLYGVGAVTISLTIPSTESGTNVMILSTLNTYGENHFENLNIEITNGRYVVHDDDGGPYKNRTIEFKNCTFKHNGNTVPAWIYKDCIGAGYTGGRKGIFKNCRMECPYTPIYIHTSSSLQMTDKCFIEIQNCVLISNQNQPSVDFQDAYGATNTAIAHINNSYLSSTLQTRGTNPFVVYGGGNNNFGVSNTTTTPSKIYIVGNSNSDFTS